MSDLGVTLTLRIERTVNRRMYKARVDEIDLVAIGISPEEAVFALGQNLCAFAQNCIEQRKDMLDLVNP